MRPFGNGIEDAAENVLQFNCKRSASVLERVDKVILVVSGLSKYYEAPFRHHIVSIGDGFVDVD